MAFRIDIEDASGNKIGDGPITTAISLTQQISLDKIGGIDISIPATEYRTQYLTAGRYVHVYHDAEGDLGTYLVRERQVSDSGDPVLVVACDDLLVEMTRTSVHFHRSWSNEPVEDVIDDLIALMTGWSTGTIESGIGNTTLTAEGESVFRILDELRDRWGRHFRLSGTRTLDFGAFGTSSGLRLVNREAIPREAHDNVNVAYITSIEMTEESDEVWNTVIPLGGGEGLAQLTIANAQAGIGDYTKQVGTNDDGTSYYYIQDATSVASYGTREKILVFPQIRPVTNSSTAIQYAANALQLSAEAYLKRHLVPKTTYAVRMVGVQSLPSVGDKVHLRYKGLVNAKVGTMSVPFTYLDIDTDFYVMDVNRTLGVGQREITLNIAEVAHRRTTDADTISEMVHDLQVLKTHVRPGPAYASVGPYLRRLDSSHDAEFTIRIKEEVLDLVYCKLRFRTGPLRSSVTSVAAGGGTTQTSSSGGGSTQTSSASSSSTTASGGSSTQTSTSTGGPSYQHSHNIGLSSGTSGNTVYYYAGSFYTSGGGTIVSGVSWADLSVHSHDVNIPPHVHGMDHTHTVTIPPHTHTVTIPPHTHGMSYGIYQDTQYPGSVTVEIDGTDRTATLGGPWGTTSTSVEVEVEISDYLKDAGLQQNHRIVFGCAAGQGEIEVEADPFVVVQAIVLS